LAIVAGQAIADGADALITIGGIQSNHARAHCGDGGQTRAATAIW
jgi:1-aminocyclopropane-1-carboxylate deaminase/D-cysteine desulfhydrase-like pyridoxal-dependent ACC family enzyme